MGFELRRPYATVVGTELNSYGKHTVAELLDETLLYRYGPEREAVLDAEGLADGGDVATDRRDAHADPFRDGLIRESLSKEAQDSHLDRREGAFVYVG
ncbi:hypothetical protein GCM10022254_39230 [Actinomadura meridiana]|uniref:Uncharacterized protein n=1 Tax=Actinomadura meridiana TaxID=559626 RepID=A0ABP8C659_9ACTN